MNTFERDLHAIALENFIDAVLNREINFFVVVTHDLKRIFLL